MSCMSQNYRANVAVQTVANWTADTASDALALTQYNKVGLVFTWGPLTGALTTTSWDIEVSNDGTNWAAITTAVSPGSNASGVDAVSISDVFFNYLRINPHKGSVSAGPYSVTATLMR